MNHPSRAGTAAEFFGVTVLIIGSIYGVLLLGGTSGQGIFVILISIGVGLLFIILSSIAQSVGRAANALEQMASRRKTPPTP